MRPCKTRANTVTQIVGTKPVCILSSSPLRKAFIMSPVSGGVVSLAPVAAKAFNAGLAQPWQVPLGVTQIVTMYLWGCGGNPGAAGAGLGGGGGGGSEFRLSGPQPSVPGQIWTVNVQAGGAGADSSILNPASVNMLNSKAGGNGLLDAAGVGGTGGGGLSGFGYAGGAGQAATGLAGAGGVGGGSGGTYSLGSTPTGGGGASLLGFGQGGAGGVGSSGVTPAGNGLLPGGGGGGDQANGVTPGVGADGLAVIFYVPSQAQSVISMGARSDVVPGQGSINYLSGATFPTTVTDEEIGSIIREEWWIVSSIAGQVVQITEYLYESPPEDY